jgi:hypothetical protein
MSRFFSEHEIRKNENKLNDQLINAEKYKEELKGAINKENHRINVDSAKKKAVIQRMDYDGFHQMVLGADLKGIKEKEMKQLKPESIILNNVAIAHKLSETKDIYQKNFVPLSNNKLDINHTITEKLNSLNIHDGLTLKQFEKNFVKNLSSSVDKISYLLELSLSEFTKLFENSIIETDLFLHIILHIATFIIERNKEIDNSKLQHLFDIINFFQDNNQYKVLRKFITKKYKSLFDNIESETTLIMDEATMLKWNKIKPSLITNP